MKKILFVSSAFCGGGVTTYAREVIACYAAECQMDIMFRGCTDQHLEGIHRAYDYDCTNLNVSNAQRVCNLINNEIKPDAIIISNAPLVMLLSPFLKNDIKVISVSHSLRNKEATNAALTHRFIDSIVALSEAGQKYLQHAYGIPIRKLPIIYNFVREHPQRKSLIKEKIHQRPLLIVFPGSCSAVKSPDIVLAILQKLVTTDWNFAFKWIGGLNPTQKSWFTVHDVSKLVPVDERVQFLGRVPHDIFAEIVSQANIVLSPSRREGCPMVLLEAMRVGCITLVADYDVANKELVKNGVSGFVIAHNDIDHFVSLIGDIVKHPESYLDYYDASFRTFQEELSFVAWKRKMDAVITDNTRYHERRKEHFNQFLYRCWVAWFMISRQWDNFYRYAFEKIPTLYKINKLRHNL